MVKHAALEARNWNKLALKFVGKGRGVWPGNGGYNSLHSLLSFIVEPMIWA